MFGWLKIIDTRLYDRYLTLERNVKAASNSFYDSYLDLQEQFVRTVGIAFDLYVDSRETCGSLLRRIDIIEVFRNKLGLDEYTFNKMSEYTLKVNAHKHKGEKHIEIATIVSYMRILYDATGAFCRYKKIEYRQFDAQYYIDIFDIFAKENAALREDQANLRDELKELVEQHRLREQDIAAYQNMLTQRELDNLSLEEQNHTLQVQISKLKDIKLASLEDKLDRTLELLNELKPAIVENRKLVRAVGGAMSRMITGDSNIDRWIDHELADQKGTNEGK